MRHALLALGILGFAAHLAFPQDTSRSAGSGALPLKPERTLRLVLREGSWISLDVSPDGKTIVFELLGDLYTVPITGGRARPLTRGMAFDSQPRYSPDGRRIVFVSDRDGAENLWILDLVRGDTIQLTEGRNDRYESPAWTPDGRYIVVSKGSRPFTPTKLWLYHIDGGSGIPLIREPENLRTVGAAVSPDGRYIWFAQRTGTWQYNAILPQYQLAVYDRQTGRTYVRSSRYGSAFRPTLSPDGRWLVYGTRHEAQTGLRLRDLHTGEERWLAYPVQRDDQESVASRDVLPGMAFTPDSRELVASFGGRIWRIPIDGGPAIEVPFEVELELPIGPELRFQYPITDEPTFTVRQIRDAVPSPDGRRLAFTALNRLYVMDFPRGSPRRLTKLELVEAQPAWSPDGRWIAFSTWSEQEGGHIYRVRVDGRELMRLSSRPAVYWDPAWSPDGERIVVIRGPARSYQEASGPRAPEAREDLIWIPARGGDAVFIAPAEGRLKPHFTRNPDRIFLFHPERGLVSIRWDGSDEQIHLRVTGNTRPGQRQPNRASLILMAPHGEYALAQVNQDIYLVTVPLVGEAPTISVDNPRGAAVPVRKLTDIGGQFPAWSWDGQRVHWSIGNAHVVYDLLQARAFEDSLRQIRRQPGRSAPDTARYRPLEVRIRIQAPRDIPQGTVLLRGARLITMRGQEVIEDADLLVRNNRIAALGPRGSFPVPPEAVVLDVSGKTILPGFVDTHAHMWPAWGLHREQVWMYLANLAYGITTTRDPQTSTTDVLTYGDMVEAGLLLGPRLYATGPGVFGDYLEDPIRDLEHARRVLRRYADYYDTKTIKMYMAGNRQQRQWILLAARELGLMPTTEGGLDLKLDLTLMQDGYPAQEHSWPIYPLYEDVIKLAAFTRLYYTPTLLVSYGGPFGENYFFTRENPHEDPKLRRFTPHEELDSKTRRRGQGVDSGPGGWFHDEEYIFPRHAEVAARLLRAGGRVAVGSHGQLQGLGYHWELWALAAGGMTNHEALRCATLYGAEAIGMDRDLGSLEPGKLADLLILDRNPLENIRHTTAIRYVMKNGRLYDAETLDELWPRQRPLGKLPWQDKDPVGIPGLSEPKPR
nr:MAG: bifunctional TolB-family protein/amidohydrolase [Bacteroidota bacterium]